MHTMCGEKEYKRGVYPWGDTRPLYTYTRYIRNIFGARVQKLALDAGFSCPHRGSGRLVGGCTYCNNDAFNPSYCTPSKSVAQQLREGIEFHTNRYRRASSYLAYFQAYTNTFAGVDALRRLFSEALAVPGVIGLVIATRPDCLAPSVVEYLAELASEYYVFVELGAESSHNRTLEEIHRGHDVETTEMAVKILRREGISVGVHLIWGLPTETREMMYETVSWASALDIQSVKFHQLQILQGTQMANTWQERPEEFALFDLETYLDFLVGVVVRLRASIAIERICAEAPPRFLLAPNWGLVRNDEILRRFEGLLLARGWYQSMVS